MTENANIPVDTGISNTQNFNKEQSSEKLYTQNELDRIVVANKKAAADRAAKEVLDNLQNYIPNHQQSLTQSQSVQRPGISEDDAIRIWKEQNAISYQLAAQEAEKAQEKQAVDELVARVAASRNKYPDIANDIKILDIEKIPLPVVNSLTKRLLEVDNTADVLYALTKDEDERARIMGQLAVNNVSGARSTILRISNKLKQNSTNLYNSQSIPNAPLSQVNPSMYSVDDNGTSSVAEFRKNPAFYR